jgi:hypothetical protein
VQVRYPELMVEEGRVVLPPNQRLNQEDILEEVLKVLNKPSHVSSILEQWQRSFMDSPISEAGIRSVAVRDKSRFFSIGRTSTYGLRCWEEERPELKGGTIRKLAEEILSESGSLMHIDELTTRLRPFRPTTTSTSVRYNLQLETSGRFVLYPGGYVGLSNKVQPVVPPPPVAVPGSLMRARYLKRFIGFHRNELVRHLIDITSATSFRVETVVHEAIKEGRILADGDGVIRVVRDASISYGPAGPELPFE